MATEDTLQRVRVQGSVGVRKSVLKNSVKFSKVF